MLTSLSVSDFALFSSASFLPEEGFSALTGQTGAGKSLVVDALAFVTGSRKGREFIRRGADSCRVSAVFSPVSDERLAALSELGVECDSDGIEFSRTLSTDARGVCRINGRITTLSVLRQAASLFCDIHEQEDAHALLDASSHINYLDAFADGDFAVTKGEYDRCYDRYTELKRRFQSLYSADREEERVRREFLEYQIQELTSAKIIDGEYESLLKKKERLSHAKRLADATASVKEALASEGGVYDRLMTASASLASCTDAAPEWGELAEKLETLAEETREIALCVTAEEVEDPTATLDSIEERLSALRRLFSLYAPTERELLLLLEEKKQALFDLDNAKQQARCLHAEALSARDEAAKVALKLRKKRTDAARVLEREILAALAQLDLGGVRFEVRLGEREKISPTGLDSVEFYIGTNVGQPMMPLSAIASGGELSRILLALRLVLSEIDGIDTLVFDEIDTGVSGKSAAKIGRAMRSLGGHRQVLAVTHSAQVAGAAHAQIKVEKTVEDGDTKAALYPLDETARVEEIARILSGETLSE
ncbi:MAG: DNA repair protein RecN, partial [Clostridia bacterium]|nr:DNA repair protein RecN [Clostridia bacterium]